ncbi:hypothetical protein CHUAL_007446 [Chamberlinius hualienensis]
MAFIAPLFQVAYILAFLLVVVKLHVNIHSEVDYQNGHWVGNVVCHFINESKCALSFHSQGRRIDVDTSRDKENVFVSCLTSNSSIALRITNVTYDDIQDYACLNDVTQVSDHSFLDGNPILELEGIAQVGALIRLTCNSYVGAPLYWILPGSPQDHKDITITNSSNVVNSSTTAVFTLNNNDNFAEYRCCIKSKNNQPTGFSCASHTFIFGDVQLISTSANFITSSKMIMTCIYSGPNVPDYKKIDWQQCTSSSSCYTISSSSYYINTIDELKLNTTLQYSYSSSYPIYKCRYNGATSYTFNVNIGAYSPNVVSSGKEIYYSNDGYAVVLECSIDANPQPSITWIKTDALNFANGSQVITNGGNYTIVTDQVSANNWKSVLTIFPYDINTHNSIYTCVAKNTLGQQSTEMNTNEGPAEVDLKLVWQTSLPNRRSVITAMCTFKTFPFSHNYDIIVTTVNNTTLTLTENYVSEFFFTSVAISFQAYTQIYPAAVECIAFNRFDKSSVISNRIVITAANFTTFQTQQLRLPHIKSFKIR